MTMKLAYTLACLKFIKNCLYTLIVPFLPLILRDKGIEDHWIGIMFRYNQILTVYSIPPFATIIFAPLASYLSPYLGRKIALIYGCII